jgi:hypothetical protein
VSPILSRDPIRAPLSIPGRPTRNTNERVIAHLDVSAETFEGAAASKSMGYEATTTGLTYRFD